MGGWCQETLTYPVSFNAPVRNLVKRLSSKVSVFRFDSGQEYQILSVYQLVEIAAARKTSGQLRVGQCSWMQ